MAHGVFEAELVDLVFDDRLATPARIAAGQIRLAVTGRIEEFGELRVFELVDACDFVLLGCLFVDQVALRGVGRISALA